MRRCPYCCFYHIPHSPEHEAQFIRAACREIRSIPDELGCDVSLHTVYWGGGTPSCLETRSLDALRSALDPLIPAGLPEEFTVELNPEDVSDSLLRHLRSMGVNRISLGVQSMDAAAQKTLHRCPPAVNERAMSLVRGRFENINVDVLIGTPDGGQAGLRQTLQTLSTYRPTHFSVYCLERGETGEPSSASFFGGVDDERSADQYLLVCEFLRERGYHHYEVSNFSLPGYESLHNRSYWSGGEYVGVGPAAHSFVNGRRYCNRPSLESYLNSTAHGGAPSRIYDDEKRDDRLERIMLALRTDRGMPVGWLSPSSRILEELVERGLAASSGGRLILSDRGFLLLDEIVVRICDENGNRPAERR